MSHWIGCSARLLALAASLLFFGCARPLEPVMAGRPGVPTGNSALGAAAVSAGQLFYPLEVGNHWSYENVLTIDLQPPEGGGPSEFRDTYDADLVGHDERFGRDYVVQRETYHDLNGDSIHDYLYRQDYSGYFNADPEPTDEVAAASAPGEGQIAAGESEETQVPLDPALSSSARRAISQALRKVDMIRQVAAHGFVAGSEGRGTPGPLEGEIALLAYPLRDQSQWQVRPDPLVINTVEGQESLELPAGRFNAWRIQIDWPGVFGPNDRAYSWYGRDGFLKLFVHAESVLTDDQGNPYATAVVEQTTRLTGLSLVAP